MKLKYYIKDNKKIYTLKETFDKEKTYDAHYKFIKFKTEENKEQQ